MQAFGKFATKHELEYLTQHYLYIPLEDEVLSVQELNTKLAKKRKHVAGTIFLFNPCVAPKGFDVGAPLEVQNFPFPNDFVELKLDEASDVFGSALQEYKGKLIEIKYLFNHNIINSLQFLDIIDTYNNDLERFNSNQTTRFDKELNYHETKDIRLSGKFVFFAWGSKFINKKLRFILEYAQSIYTKAEQNDKTIAFIYKISEQEADAIRHLAFGYPVTAGKAKPEITTAVKKAFSTTPPGRIAYNVL